MYLLDENITKDQKELLEKWRFRFKQIGVDFKNKGIKDEQIITLLQQIKGVLFITRDTDFFKKQFCRSNYCIVFLDVEKYEVAFYIKKFLSHPLFNNNHKRLGKINQIKSNLYSVLYFKI
ncbi:MAG: hypothetical protein M3Z92_07480 [Bacteroidota bacterium]|nr:hypothetical protein [Bacteroidota bacterium]MDQ6889470.1 hypothetical protein [Bacteroidota bacterium]